MPLTRASNNTASLAVNANIATAFRGNRVPSTSDGTWIAFFRPDTLPAAGGTGFNIITSTTSAAGIGWGLGTASLSATTLKLFQPGSSTLGITGPVLVAGTNYALAWVLSGVNATFFWKVVGTPGWSSGTSAAFALYTPLQFTLQVSTVSCLQVLWGIRYWAPGNNPTSAAALEPESRSLFPVRRPAGIIMPLGIPQGQVHPDFSGNRAFATSTSGLQPTKAGCVLATPPIDVLMKNPVSEAVWSASQRSMRNPLLGL